MDNDKGHPGFHLLTIVLLLISNALVLTVMVSQEKKDQEVERQLRDLTEHDQYSTDIWYSVG